MRPNMTKSDDVPIGLKGLLRGLWSQEGTLGQKAVRGGFWVMGSTGVGRMLGMVQTIILVRLLVPEDFGIMRVAGFLLAAMMTFTETGMSAAVIQRKDIDDATLDTAWTIQIVREMILFAAVFLVAPWAARFYENPVICPILRVVGLRFLIGAFDNIGVALLRKELDFRRHELFEVTITVVSMVVTVVAAFILRSVWALAIGQVAFACARLAGSYVVHPYRPRVAFHWSRAVSLIRFGKHLLALSIVVFLKTQLDGAILGKMLGMEALGFYALAYALSNLPATWLITTTSGVTFSAYSKLQDDRRRLGRAFLRVLSINSVISVPAAAGLFVLAPEIVNVVYGAKYAPMIPAFRVLCFFGLLRSLAMMASPVFKGIGKPYLVTYVMAGNVVVMLGLIYPLTKAMGITGTAWATLIPYLAHVPVCFAIVCSTVGLEVFTVFRTLWAPTLASVLMVVTLQMLKGMAPQPSVIALGVLIAVGIAVYFCCLPLLGPRLVSDIRDLGKALLDRTASPSVRD